MNILILHRIPYQKINYHLGIDHDRHNVTYIGTAKQLANLPEGLRCARLERPGLKDTASEVLAILSDLKLHFDRVISLSEYELLDAAKVREALGVPGASIDEVMAVRDKLIMKHRAAAAGLRVPQALPLAEFLAQGGAPWPGRTVIKPVDGASSEDVQVFDDPASLASALESRQAGIPRLDQDLHANAERFEVETFITGPLLHLDGLVHNGKVVALVGSRYIGTCLDYAKGQPLGSVQFKLDAAQEQWVQRAIDAISLRSGAFHLEVIDDNGSGDWVFLEIANRVGGADVVDTFEMATGIYLPAQELAILCGEQPDLPGSLRKTTFFGWFVFPGHHLPDGFVELDGHQSFCKSSELLRHSVLPRDTPLPRNITYQAFEVPFSGVVGAESTTTLQAWMEALFAAVTLHPRLQEEVREVPA
ncbi:ATP-grasp domain-containing protein [Chromobacterium vaccinii]|uniref:ATP-grasp domain-containing protein n=1 Tax=Chromobacterium vaccinii TaxID=1108595 RepID=UPI001E52121B|nr:ATP-grasp domain-containing protein [Chromobacterium vaccinii]MCD4498882.1 ATP-grasp domain-containing protein [Chromobacterium vaccinii]